MYRRFGPVAEVRVAKEQMLAYCKRLLRYLLDIDPSTPVLWAPRDTLDLGGTRFGGVPCSAGLFLLCQSVNPVPQVAQSEGRVRVVA
jgi:hypothetical protein